MEASSSHHRHRPCHLFIPEATYIVTGSILHKKPLLQSDRAKDIVLRQLFETTAAYGWDLQAWAVLNNHYHFVCVAPEDPKTLETMVKKLHSDTGIAINELLNSPGRQVWYQYWDTCITNERSHLARLHYVHQNPQKHGVVRDAARYRWCSMRWLLEQDAEAAERVLSAPIDTVNVYDDFD